MTRILSWNIEEFDLLRIENPTGMNLVGGGQPQDWVPEAVAATACSNYILENLSFTDPGTGNLVAPDIIVVIEVSVNDTYPPLPLTSAEYQAQVGRLASGLGGQGAVLLLNRIRAATGVAEWMLVPPLVTGAKEAVAVYFDSRNYCFAGPARWPGGEGPAVDAGVTVAYAAPFDTVLPDSPIPAGLPNATLSQRHVAASTMFTIRDGIANAGDPFPWEDRARRPYWVTFGELDNNGAVRRTISLFAIHSPADVNRAAYVTSLGNVQQIAAAPADNEVKIVLGDFNVNLMAADFTLTPAFNNLVGAGYGFGLAVPGAQPADPSGYRGYFATTIKAPQGDLGQSGRKAQFWYNTNAAGQNPIFNYYPGYGYTGTPADTNVYALDNILARFGNNPNTGQPCGVLANFTILNGVVVTPYTVVNPNGAPTGYYQFPWQMTDVLFANPASPLPVQNAAAIRNRKTALQQWLQYGHIRWTSDHMPIVADV